MYISIYLFVVIATSITSLYVNYPLIKSANVSMSRKIMGSLIIIFHDILNSTLILLNIVILYSIFKTQSYKIYLIFLNIIVLSLIISYLLFKMCVITLLTNIVLDLPKCQPYRYIRRANLYIDNDANCTKNTLGWLKTSMVIIMICMVYNIYYILTS
jgi:hypothetical protein